MQLKKLNKLLEDIVDSIKSTKIINTDNFQLILSSDNKTIYIDNITEENQLVNELLEIIRDYVGLFIPSLNVNSLNPDDILILSFDEEYNEEDLINAIKQYELLNSNEEFKINKLEKPEILF